MECNITPKMKDNILEVYFEPFVNGRHINDA